jgi:hypothetical protein
MYVSACTSVYVSACICHQPQCICQGMHHDVYVFALALEASESLLLPCPARPTGTRPPSRLQSRWVTDKGLPQGRRVSTPWLSPSATPGPHLARPCGTGTATVTPGPGRGPACHSHPDGRARPPVGLHLVSHGVSAARTGFKTSSYGTLNRAVRWLWHARSYWVHAARPCARPGCIDRDRRRQPGRRRTVTWPPGPVTLAVPLWLLSPADDWANCGNQANRGTVSYKADSNTVTLAAGQPDLDWLGLTTIRSWCVTSLFMMSTRLKWICCLDLLSWQFHEPKFSCRLSNYGM